MSTENHLSKDLITGQLRLAGSYLPGIKAGSYRIAVRQTVTAGDDHHYYQDKRFVVKGPRWTLPPEDFHSAYPIDSGSGDYSRVLPYIVLSKRALPWERSVSDTDGEKPWLALLIFSDREQQLINKTKLQESETELLHPADFFTTPKEQNLLLPELESEGDEQDKNTIVQALDVPRELFLSVCPTYEELDLLAHLRLVSTQQKPRQKMHADGEYSVVMSNRFPVEGTNHAYLVSLEGWEKLLTQQNKQAGSTVRLVYFKSWSFVNHPQGAHTFSDLVNGLDSATFGITPPAEAPIDAYTRQALANAYVPVKYQPTQSAEHIAWYRGPFAPTLPKGGTVQRAALVRTADEALVYDPARGTMNISYAAAWELGRLLALSSPTFSKALKRLNRSVRDVAEAATKLNTYLTNNTSEFEGLWRNREADKEARKITLLPSVRKKVQDAIALTEWLGRLAMLYPVPYNYLIGHPDSLPPESLRFFHLDKDWIDMLIEGAFSLGLQDSWDPEVEQEKRQQFRQQIAATVSQYRQHQLGKEAMPSKAPDQNFFTQAHSGFVLRSTLASAWPGLEFEAKDATGTVLKIIRLEHLDKSRVFALVEGVIETLTIKQPPEGLHFGLDDEGAVMIRKLTQPDFGTPLQDSSKSRYAGMDANQLHPVPQKNEAADRISADTKLYRVLENLQRHAQLGELAIENVISISALNQNLTQLTNSPAALTSAEFALEMLVAPEEKTFQWTKKEN